MQNPGDLFLNLANLVKRRENRGGGRRAPPPSRRRDFNYPRDGVRKVRIPATCRALLTDLGALGPTILSSLP